PFRVLFIERGVGNRQVVVAALEVARQALVEHDELRPTGMRGGTRSGFLGPSCAYVPREGGVAGQDQDSRAFCAHGRFLTRPIGTSDFLWRRGWPRLRPRRRRASPVSTGD